MTRVIVLDIEGTTSPTTSVHDQLFGYVRERIPQWVADQASDQSTGHVPYCGTDHGAGSGRRLLAEVREQAGQPYASNAEVADILRGWLDENVKYGPLKTIQGFICGEGFRNGELRGEFFPDVPPAIRRWRSGGSRVFVYSSGSEQNQRDWFAHASTGPLDACIEGYFDLASAGSKRTTAAYRRIVEAVSAAPDDMLFLTDSPHELAAASGAGWPVLGVARPGEPQQPVPPHEWITSFNDVDLNP